MIYEVFSPDSAAALTTWTLIVGAHGASPLQSDDIHTDLEGPGVAVLIMVDDLGTSELYEPAELTQRPGPVLLAAEVTSECVPFWDTIFITLTGTIVIQDGSGGSVATAYYEACIPTLSLVRGDLDEDDDVALHRQRRRKQIPGRVCRGNYEASLSLMQ